MNDTDISTTGDAIATLIVLIVMALGFFLPFIVALFRGHKRTSGVFFLNIVIGWTGIGWIFLLIYSVLSEAKE